MLKLMALVALFAGFCWVGTHLQLGQHTLFGHLRAIAQTKESQDLFDGTRTSAQPLVDDVRRRIAGVPATPAKEPGAPVEESDDAPESKGEVAKADETKSDKATADSTKSDKAKSDKAKSDKAKSDKATADKATADKAKTDKVTPDSAEDRFARADHHPSKGGAAQETLTPSERRRLRRLISATEGASARQ